MDYKACVLRVNLSKSPILKSTFCKVLSFYQVLVNDIGWFKGVKVSSGRAARASFALSFEELDCDLQTVFIYPQS